MITLSELLPVDIFSMCFWCEVIRQTGPDIFAVDDCLPVLLVSFFVMHVETDTMLLHATCCSSSAERAVVLLHEKRSRDSSRLSRLA